MRSLRARMEGPAQVQRRMQRRRAQATAALMASRAMQEETMQTVPLTCHDIFFGAVSPQQML